MYCWRSLKEISYSCSQVGGLDEESSSVVMAIALIERVEIWLNRHPVLYIVTALQIHCRIDKITDYQDP